MAAEQPLTGFASAEGLTPNGDNLHFNAKSLLTFGERYYKEFKKFEINVSSSGSVSDDLERTELERL
jgi:hypothetical protein